jgi:hypothetical protein
MRRRIEGIDEVEEVRPDRTWIYILAAAGAVLFVLMAISAVVILARKKAVTELAGRADRYPAPVTKATA